MDDIIKPYLFLMDNAMLGIGVGFDTKCYENGFKILPVRIADKVNQKILPQLH